jgi:predicted DNA-binding transcriptional regulator AlpA
MKLGNPAATQILNAGQVARMLGHSRNWFNAHLPQLRRAGFPKRDQLLGGWHAAAVQRWIDSRIEECAPSGDDELNRRAQQWAA